MITSKLVGNTDGFARIRSIRELDDRHHLTLVCQDFAQMGQFVYLANPVFKAIEPTTVIDFSHGKPEILRHGAGDSSAFE